MKIFNFVAVALILSLSFTNCKKEDEKTIPGVNTTNISEIKALTAISGGDVTKDGGFPVTKRGVCWGLNPNPTISDSTTNDGEGVGAFVSNLAGLNSNTTYYLRAYATNSLGTAYGNEVTFSTSKINNSESISLGAAYANDVYYSLKNGIVATVPRSSWDIAFSVSTRSSSIIINESTGIVVKAYPKTATWATNISDTTGFSTWISLRNSNTDWEVGAFNANATGHPNYGWGNYNANTHNIEGVAIYIIKFANGTLKKILIDIKNSALQKYTFRYADLNGANEQVVTNMDLSNSKANFVYYSLQNNARLDREPNTTSWDLLFTKWEDISSSQPYMVTGVLQNIGIKSIDLTVTDPLNISYTDSQFISDINNIGYDWKTFTGSAYSVPSNRVFVVKALSGKTYKVTFTSFAGSSTGNLSFTVAEV